MSLSLALVALNLLQGSCVNGFMSQRLIGEKGEKEKETSAPEEDVKELEQMI